MKSSMKPAGMLIYEAAYGQGEPGDINEPFAWEEYFCRKVGEGNHPIFHIWRHPKAVVLGHRDRRLPMAAQAMQELEKAGWSVCVRPSGGAAVVLDQGVVNVSVILPNHAGTLNIHDDFKMMASLIRQATHPWSSLAVAGEIEGAFCPGDYDISIGGRKFCGIAQRRQAKAYILTAFVIVEGSGDKRASLIRNFYEQASGGLPDGYPVVEQGTMGSLQELCGVPAAESYIGALKQAAEQRFGAAAVQEPMLVPEQAKRELIANMKRRYQA